MDSPKFLPCICNNIGHHGICEFVGYHPQDIARGEKLARLEGFPGFVLAYKYCYNCYGNCKIFNPRLEIVDRDSSDRDRESI